jgi:hypothetical protein
LSVRAEPSPPDLPDHRVPNVHSPASGG